LHPSIRKLIVFSVLLAFSAGLAVARPAQKKSGSSRHHSSSRHRRARKTSWKRRGQQQIDSDRARAIQEALIREKYLTGDPTGVWDARSQAAMSKFQEDNGWQSKVTPDSRALIKLGLGPDYSKEQLLNPPAKSDSVAANAAAVHSGPTSDVDKQ
jgi:peptidoglycan hydrolase-like protein with peptidoglycan-binding domain